MNEFEPWSLRLASWCWAIAGFVFVLTPALATLLLWLQYRSLRGQAYRLTDLAELVDVGDRIDLAPYLAEFERIEAWLLDVSGWVLLLIGLLYLLGGGLCLVLYLLVSRFTARGENWARITGTVLAVLSSIVAAFVWQTFLPIAWLPVDALWANHLGLVLIGLHVAGVVLVWLPASNAFVRQRATRIPPAPLSG